MKLLMVLMGILLVVGCQRDDAFASCDWATAGPADTMCAGVGAYLEWQDESGQTLHRCSFQPGEFLNARTCPAAYSDESEPWRSRAAMMELGHFSGKPMCLGDIPAGSSKSTADAWSSRSDGRCHGSDDPTKMTRPDAAW